MKWIEDVQRYIELSILWGLAHLLIKFFTKGGNMLEGPEFEQKLGEYGSAKIDLDDKANVEVSVSIKVNLVAEAKKLAAKTKTPVDDQAIAWLEKIMGLAAEQKAAVAPVQA